MNTKKNLLILLGGYSLILFFIVIFIYNIDKNNTNEGFEITLNDDINNLKKTDQDLKQQIQDLQQQLQEIKKLNEILPKKVEFLFNYLNKDYNYI
jgi:peptidoglycan hydrolase CwlO-like protein